MGDGLIRGGFFGILAEVCSRLFGFVRELQELEGIMGEIERTMGFDLVVTNGIIVR